MNQPDTSLLRTFHIPRWTVTKATRHAQMENSLVWSFSERKFERQWNRSRNYDRSIRIAVEESASGAHMQACTSRRGGFDCTLVNFFTACQSAECRRPRRLCRPRRDAERPTSRKKFTNETFIPISSRPSPRGSRRGRDPARSSQKVTF